jgi:hypothetical protein
VGLDETAFLTPARIMPAFRHWHGRRTLWPAARHRGRAHAKALQTRLDAAWAVADLRDEVYLAWATKEAPRDVYRTHDSHDARVALDEFYAWAADTGVDEYRRLARTVRRWETGAARLARIGRVDQCPDRSRQPARQED